MPKSTVHIKAETVGRILGKHKIAGRKALARSLLEMKSFKVIPIFKVHFCQSFSVTVTTF